MSQTDHYRKKKTKRAIRSMEEDLGGKTTKEFFALRIKTYSYLTDINDEDQK